jgi:hypothetical protein
MTLGRLIAFAVGALILGCAWAKATFSNSDGYDCTNKCPEKMECRTMVCVPLDGTKAPLRDATTE